MIGRNNEINNSHMVIKKWEVRIGQSHLEFGIKVLEVF